jgi:hypothetical protein
MGKTSTEWPATPRNTVLTGPIIILTLKIAVVAVTVLLAASLTALATGRRKLHGRINVVFFVLTMTAVLGLEVILRLVKPDVFAEMYAALPDMKRQMNIHLSFSIPAAVVLPVMLLTGLSHRGKFHAALGSLFLVLWTGTFVTGIFFLPHALPAAAPVAVASK